MKTLHEKMMTSSSWYRAWHNSSPIYKIVHWSAFTFFAVAMTLDTATAIDNQAAVIDSMPSTEVTASQPSNKPIPGQYIIIFKKEVKDAPGLAKQLEKEHGGKIGFTYSNALKGFSISNLSTQAVEALKRNPNIEIVEQDQITAIDGTQSPASDWGLDRLDQKTLPLSNSYTYSTDGTGVSAYVLDTGIRSTHQDFNGRVGTGYSIIADTYGTDDCNGHGTHVAGTIGGTVYGVAKNIRLFPVRIMNCTGSGSTSGAIAGIDWVTKNRVLPAVANMSLTASTSLSLNTAVQNSINSGVVYAVAAGNNGGLDACGYSPASAPQALTVGATWNGDGIPGYSNIGSCVDLFAPGSSITSAGIGSDTATAVMGGTSMAAPHVAGVTALYLTDHPSASVSEVTQAILQNASAGVISNVPVGTPNILLSSNLSAPIPPPPAGDTTPPTIPTNLTGTAVSSTRIDIAWSPSTDNVGVTGYKIFKNGIALSSTTTNSYSDTTLSAGKAYYYTVAAVDAANNTSAQSNRVDITTPAAPVIPVTPLVIGDKVVTTTKVNIRAATTTSGKPAGSQKSGAVGTIVAGPQTSSGYTWYKVDFTTGTDGWVADSYLKKQ